MICFGFGTLLGDVLLHIIPHMIESNMAKHGGHDHEGGHSHSMEMMEPYLFIIYGIFIFYIMDIYLDSHSHDHNHDHDHKSDSLIAEQQSSGIIYLIGDFIHNFSDGLSVGASFALSNRLGLTTTIATMLHEIPHEIGDFAVLIKKNYSIKQILVT